jgi:RHH-type proline utilization regulon transcriptional repressor/proline dehydrogenase/delta 1-pyrroline-5-carboxylate dehydrogenase
VREKRTRASGVDALMHEFSLSSEEGVALMCLAEALLRIPDTETADRLIADKISKGDWKKHLGESPSLFVNAATWGLLITGKLVASSSEKGLGAALTRMIAKGGEPLIRKGVDLAMRMLGNQFVTGQTIDEALKNSRDNEARGYRYSYDMLGEAALTEPTPTPTTPPTKRRSTRSARPRTAAASRTVRASRSSCRPCIRATAARSAPA